MKLTDVTGVGSAGVFLIEGRENFLFEAGMAYAADRMIQNIEKALKGGRVDAVLLSHSHYDHVAGLTAVRKRWPEVKVYASKRAQEILTKPSALAVIRSLSREAADAAGMDYDRDYEDKALSVDVGLEDGEVFQLGDFTVRVLETIGHTKCSVSYIVNDELMLCSETVGVMTSKKKYIPSFLVDYREVERSIEKSAEIPVKQIILNHYGLVSDADMPHIWEDLLREARRSKEMMIEVMNRHDTETARLEELEHIFHTGISKSEQPDGAFTINAVSMMKTLQRQFPERFDRKGGNICS